MINLTFEEFVHKHLMGVYHQKNNSVVCKGVTDVMTSDIWSNEDFKVIIRPEVEIDLCENFIIILADFVLPDKSYILDTEMFYVFIKEDFYKWLGEND